MTGGKRKPNLKVVKMRKPAVWIYDHLGFSVVVYGERKVGGQPNPQTLDLKTVNFLLDMAKKRLLE